MKRWRTSLKTWYVAVMPDYSAVGGAQVVRQAHERAGAQTLAPRWMTDFIMVDLTNFISADTCSEQRPRSKTDPIREGCGQG
jgi:hypothetical protein